MEPDQIIERIGTDNPPTPEELAAAVTELTAAQESIKESIVAAKDGDLSNLLELKGQYDAVSTALTQVSEALGAAQAEVDAILAEVTGGETADATTENEGDTAEAEAEPVAASIRDTMTKVRAAMKQKADAVDITDEVTKSDLSTVTTTFELMGKARDVLTGQEVGEAFEKAASKFSGRKTVVASINTKLAPERTLDGNASANERKMLDLFGANPVVPVTASGGCCSIPEPIYDQPLIGSLDRPIRAAFDVLSASRGAVQAYPPVCLPDEGADVWTCAQDSAVEDDDPDTWKSCAKVECEDSDPVLVEALYKCLTIGTFQQRFAPEQWRAHLFQVDKLAARLAEARLFNWLSQSATSVYEGLDTGSTFVNFIRTQLRIAAALRQDQRLGDSQIVTVGPDWIYTSIVEDTITRRLDQVEEAEILKSKVDSILSEYGITYVGSPDIAAMDPFSYSGALPDYPATAPMVTLPAGSAKVLDGGEKNLGIDLVDVEGARKNEVAAFSEFWEGLLVRNCNVVFSNIDIQACGTVADCPS